MSILEIKNCFDSHTHFLATGQVSEGLSLRELTDENDVETLKILPSYQRAHWLTGFGWDHNVWKTPKLPNKNILDRLFPDQPVFFSRVDGHASWINSKAFAELEKLGMNFSKDPVGGKIIRDEFNAPTGVLIDQAHIQALMRLPEFSNDQTTSFLKTSMQIFNQAGFTHVRDLSMSQQIWTLLQNLQSKNQMTVCVEGFITAESVQDLERAFQEYQFCVENPNPLLRIKGLKIFVDGSLGSKTAYLSQPYVNENHCGLISWSAEQIQLAIQFCWKNKCEIAVHVIGDQAAHIVAESARKVSAEGLFGRLHLEHAQLLRGETIQILKPLHVHCHMQPCHWLSDHKWLNQTIGDLSKYLFPWEALRRNKIPISFGSDSPIEPTSLLRNWQALTESSLKKPPRGIAKLTEDWTAFHAHPDPEWTQSRTVFDENKIHQVYFNEKPLL